MGSCPDRRVSTTLSHVESLFDTRAADVISSAILVVVVLVGRTVAVRYVRNQEWANVQMSRRWMVQVRNFALLLLFFGLTVIWAEQLRSAARDQAVKALVHFWRLLWMTDL